jgi:alpha-D-ribose 1-methylphosphonate 5-triphosphate synthase subunit PhnG
MNRRRRTEILIKGSSKVAKALAERIESQYKVSVIEEPNNGLVMVKMRESAKKSLFYLGEIFVTESKVQIQGTMGIGIVNGNESQLAYHLAVIDAAYNAKLEESKDWDSVLLEEEKRIRVDTENYQSKILKTKVNFETMDV